MKRDTLLRQIHMLMAIPRLPLKRTTGQIVEHLRGQGEHKISKRSVERNLEQLRDDFHFDCEEQGRTKHWFYPADTKVLDLPAMNAPVALAFLLSKEHLQPIMPPSTLKLLVPHFSKAQDAIREVPGSLPRWRDRVCVVTRGPRLQSPKILEAVQSEVYDAVLKGKQLSIEYRARNTQATKKQVINPWGLIVYEGVIYLVATSGTYTEPVTYTLHRIKTAKILDADSNCPSSFKLADYAAKTMRFPLSDATFKLVARFAPAVATHLEERPLSQDQVVTPGEDYVEISATVADTEDLRWWLLGFGELVQVMQPKQLRTDIAKRLKQAAKGYDA